MMILLNTREAAQAWVEEQRRLTDEALADERMRRRMIAWMLCAADYLWPRRAGMRN